MGSTEVRRRVAVTVAWVGSASVAAWALTRLAGLDAGPLVQLLAFTPYSVIAALIATILATVLRCRAAAALAAVATILLITCVAPRALADAGSEPLNGVQMRVLTANLLKGNANSDALVGIIKADAIDVLAVQELTPAAAVRLDALGLATVMPFRHLVAEPGTTGSGLYSRFPLIDVGLRRNVGGFAQAYATVQVPKADPTAIESAHPAAPYALNVLDDWRADLAGQPRATNHGPMRILLGDFNSTLDHRGLRALIDSGYRDAADAVGAGLIGTWGPYDGDVIPPVTIDHVLVDRRIGIADVVVYDLLGSDHRPVSAKLLLPPR